MSEENKLVVRAIEEAWDNGKLDELDQHFSPDFQSHAAVPAMPAGIQGAKIAHGMSMQAFPDRKVEIQDMIAEGDKVLVRSRVTGTNRGGLPWIGAPANDRPVDFEGWSIYRIRDGKVVEHWGINDAFAMAVKLGVIELPSMPGG